MLTQSFVDHEQLATLINEELRPYVQRIDEDAYYAKHFIEQLGEEGFFTFDGSEAHLLLKRLAVIEETAKVCMTTAFCIWCHLAATIYLSYTENEALKRDVLPDLIKGRLLCGTALSNPLKSFARLEKLHLKAKRVTGGYTVSGSLPAVSNIGPHQAFAFIAEADDGQKIMGLVYCHGDGIRLHERIGFIGVNGSATYSAVLEDIFIPDEQIISTKVDAFIEQIRPQFLAYQIPLAIGVTEASIATMEKLERKHEENNINRHLPVQPASLQKKNNELRARLQKAVYDANLNWDQLVDLRLQSVYTTLEAVQAAMLHHGGGGYVQSSVTERKLREAYFLVNLTPTVKHLEAIKTE